MRTFGELFYNALWRKVIGCMLIATVAYAYPDRPADPDAAWKASGMKEIQYNHRDECWSGPAPSWAPKVPGHVIMRVENGVQGGQWFYGGKRWVGIALNDVFTKDNPDVYVLSFCK